MKIKISLFVATLSFFMSSCMETDPYIRTVGTVGIEQFSIPDSGEVNVNVPMEYYAVAPNSCWSNLRANLVEVKDFHYIMIARGLYESTGSCGTMEVELDSTYQFKPESAGKYFFQINQSPYTVYYDTLIVE